MTAAPPAVSEDKITRDLLKIAGVVVLGSIMSILDTTVVNVALPTFQHTFNVADYSTVAWTVTGYTLALATVIPMAGWAADRFGTKRLYMTALALFTLGSVLCALAWNIGSLVSFRVLQGLGGGMLMPLGMTILTRAAGAHRMGRLMAVLGIPMLLGPIAGPILGGWLIDAASWHWIFLINLPLGVAALSYARVALPRDRSEPSESFDLIGMLLMSPGLALFLYGVSSIPSEGTVASAKVLIPGLIGVALLISFVFWAFRPRHPLLDLRLFKNRDLAIAAIVMFLFAGAFFGALLLVPTYFQQVRGESVLKAGLLVAPQGLGAMLTMPIFGTLADKYPVGRVVPFGFVTIIAGLIGLTQSTGVDTPYWQILACLFVLGLGMGGTMMPTFTAALKTLTHHQAARGSTLLNVIQQGAASIGVALMSVVLTDQQNASRALSAVRQLAEAKAAGLQPPAAALHIAQQFGDALQATARSALAGSFSTAFWVASGILVFTLIPVGFLPRKRQPAATGQDDEAAPAPIALH